ncbi:MAG: hypothetical protein ACRC2K_06230 [Clostridium sp.]
MFLKELNSEERIAFVNLVEAFAKVDEVFEREEKELLEDYIEELSLEKEVLGTKTLDEVIEVLSKSTERIKKVVCFELVILALVDGEYEDKELEFLQQVTNKLNIDETKVIIMQNFFLNFKEIYEFSTVDAESKIALLMEEAESIIEL